MYDEQFTNVSKQLLLKSHSINAFLRGKDTCITVFKQVNTGWDGEKKFDGCMMWAS